MDAEAGIGGKQGAIHQIWMKSDYCRTIEGVCNNTTLRMTASFARQPIDLPGAGRQESPEEGVEDQGGDQ